jgi:serine/threonine protein kinase/predicted ATPase
MGVVSRAYDESTGRTIALKQLRRAAGRTVTALFQREYHTLVLLKHPRIVEAYEYGIDPSGPYYTMELLDGKDLRALAPLTYREACRHVRDVASSLALLAAHRLVHRDLTASNIRVRSDGRCKLIDFGAVCPFGPTETVVGTPPYIAPEAFRGLPLDQRTDLFALGALAYFLLTGQHAFAAKDLSDLERSWRKRPKRPSARVNRLIEQGAPLSPIPKALDDLVLSLLSVDPVARPQSAAEVIERFAAVAGQDVEPVAHAAQSYLLSAALVGREAELAQAKALVAEATSGTGGVLSIRHAPGAGGSRLLTEIALEARIAGATVLQVDGELVRGSYAVARALGEKLLAMLPEQAKAAIPSNLDAFGWIRSSRSERPSDHLAVDPTAAPMASRLRILSALEQWFLDVAKACPLAIVVDNAQEVDDGSATLLALLADAARQHSLMCVVAFRAGDTVLSPAPMRRLERARTVLELAPLSSESTRNVVQSLFGSVPNVERLAHWVHERCKGNALELMELSQYLVSHGVARYAGGTWVLPHELPADLPVRADEARDYRLRGLGPRALHLASALAVHRGRLSLDLCLALAAAEHVDGFAALDELTSAGVLGGYEDGYRFAHKAIRERLLSRIIPKELKRFHLTLAEVLLAEQEPDYASTLEGGFHLLSGGDTARAVQILRRCGLELAEAEELPDAIPALEAAVAAYRELKRPRNELCALLHPLAFAGYYVDRRLADRYGDEALTLLAEETGLSLTARLRGYIGTYLALFVGLVYAVILHFFSGRGGPRGLSKLISITGGLTTALVGASVICLDGATAARRAAIFEPFEALGLWHAGAFCHAMAKTLVSLTEDRAWETIVTLRRLLERFDAPRGVVGFPRMMRPLTRGGLLYALGGLEGFMDEPIALSRADELEALGLRIYDMAACQIRANYYACHGDAERAREYERQVEIQATRNGSTWQAEAWAPSSRLVAYWRTFDLIGLKRAAEELERLAVEIPSLDLYARVARALTTMLRGDYEAAIPLLERVCFETAPRHFAGWSNNCARLAEAYSRTGQHARAVELCRRVDAMLTEEDRRVVALTLDIELELARAEAGSGRPEAAAQRLDALIRKHGVNRAPVTMGAIHRVAAEVASSAGDPALVRYHHARMEHWFRATKNPSLIAECERIHTSIDTTGASIQMLSGTEAATIVERGAPAGTVNDDTTTPSADRYAFLERLGAGGTAVVYRVRDEGTGRVVALKQLLSTTRGTRARAMEALFKREYHTLVRLKHPRIIEVYDYGFRPDGPYYTMELLEGRDLRQLGPLPYTEVCRHLRDVASSLALLHAQGFVHRDVSPRNIRLTADGTARLLDFGAIATFGTHSEVIGTAAFMAPEVVQTLPLDPRTDVYSLGAVGYFCLTGRAPFPARDVGELPRLWRSPPVLPSALAAEVPVELERLILSMLQVDPLGRPQTAADVIDQLTLIGRLPPEQHERTEASYLLSSAIVGRGLEIDHGRKCIEQALSGQGSELLVEGPPGIGKTRLANELCLAGTLNGTVTLRVDAETTRTRFGVAVALAQQLVAACPDVARRTAVPHVATLSAIAPELADIFGEVDSDTEHDDPSERQARAYAAMREWFLAVARERVLLVCVEDVHAADEDSAAFIVGLGRESRAAHLLVVTTLRSGSPIAAPEVVKILRERALCLKLSSLDAKACEELASGLFGGAANAGRVGNQLLHRSGGVPRQFIELAQIMVQKKIARYEGGRWVLPLDLADDELPMRAEEVFCARLAERGSDAISLAQTLAVHEGAVPLAVIFAMNEADGEARAHRALDELLAEQVLVSQGDAYRFRYEALRDAVLSRMDPETRRKNRVRAAEALLALESAGVAERVQAALLLIDAGERQRGARLLVTAASAYGAGAGTHQDPDALVRALCRTVRTVDEQNCSDYELAALLFPLMPLAYYSANWQFMLEYGERAIDIGLRITGLRRAGELAAELEPAEALERGLGEGAERFAAHAADGLDYDLKTAISATIGMVPACVATYGACFDSAAMARIAKNVAPLALFGEQHAAYPMYLFAHADGLLQGRESEARKLWERALVRFEDPGWAEAVGRARAGVLQGGALSVLGMLDCYRFGNRALTVANQMESLGVKAWTVSANQIRILYHSFRGESNEVRKYTERVEVNAMERVQTWQSEMFWPALLVSADMLAGDATAAHRRYLQLERRSREIATLEPQANAARAAYVLLRGDVSEAISLYEKLLPSLPIRKSVNWEVARAGFARALNAAGAYERAKAVAEEVVSNMVAADDELAGRFLEARRQVALAESGLGNHLRAAALLDELLCKHGHEDNPLLVGILHQARAKVAEHAKDRALADKHHAEMEKRFRSTQNPVLVAQCEHLQQDIVEPRTEPGCAKTQPSAESPR